ncbi:MAG: sulfur carrier protein ThiS [Rectinemataceae bacterium]
MQRRIVGRRLGIAAREDSEVTITVNFQSEAYDVPGMSLTALIERKRWSFPLIIARINGQLIERSDYGTAMLADGDDIELYHLVSGG